MSFPQGIAFRQNAGFVTDAATDDFENGNPGADYPRTTAQGNTVGWETIGGNLVSSRDRSATIPRLAGFNSNNSTDIDVFRIDLPAAGNYNVNLAAGEATYSANTKVELFDTTSSLGVLCSGSTGAGNSFRDAANNTRTAANWVATSTNGGTAFAATFASTICRIKVGDGSNACDIAYFYIESAGGGTNTTITATQGSLTFGGIVPTLKTNFSSTPVAGALVLAGVAPSLVTNFSRDPLVGSLVFTGVTPTLIRGTGLVPGVGALILAGIAPALIRGTGIAPGVGALVFTGIAPTINGVAAITPGAGALVFTGLIATVNGVLSIVPGVGALAFGGFQPGSLATYSIKPGVGALVLSGLQTSVFNTRLIAPGVGSLTFTGLSGINKWSLTPGAGSIIIAGGGNASTSLTPGLGSLLFNGLQPTLVQAAVPIITRSGLTWILADRLMVWPLSDRLMVWQ